MYCSDMKVQIYFCLHLCLLLCIPVNTYRNITDKVIYEKMHVQQKLCGSVLANTMTELCVQYNGLRARRSIIECCKNSCSYYYLMKYFCKESIIPLDQLPSWLASPTESGIESGPKVPQSSEHVSQSSDNNESRQEPLPNKIQKQGSHEDIKHKPAEYGYVRSTRPPIIYRHSNTIARGVMNYQIPNQSNNSQQ